MRKLKHLFGKEEASIKTYDDFWAWFQKNEQSFFKTVKSLKNVEKDFFDHVSPKLNQLKEGFSFVTGMCDENTAELILTADGTIKLCAFRRIS